MDHFYVFVVPPFNFVKVGGDEMTGVLKVVTERLGAKGGWATSKVPKAITPILGVPKKGKVHWEGGPVYPT
ncbi:hypothetical protein [Stygiolobus caldivivus]|uniref:Uncharacterized protein n=1 Tax=Stygiolobus caldivivus TaxID=2824673 RepID=A0A8D5ZEM5_9CREN|nr:hypothetical protein [Stygiolobus caldivivus]BCU69763.1 hypothetical protein KN1_10600 [Stygiolobus caldivivus]